MRRGPGLPALAGALVAALWSACANQGAPPGGPVDRRPPVVVRTEPDTFALVADLRSPVRFHFDERISERTVGLTLDDAVTVSPRTGDVRVRHGSRSLTVELEGGLRPGVVYRVTLLPIVRDLFGNQLADPFELVFSTGGSLSPNALAGQAWNRITGQGVAGARVHARGRDSLVHVAQADERGIFAFRYLPEGSFVVTGFEDLDRDDLADAREPQGTIVVDVGASDTVLVDVPILAQDTTAASLAGTQALDSLTIVLEFDDYLDPVAPSSDVEVALETDGAPAPAALVLHEHEYATDVASAPDSLSSSRAEARPRAGPDGRPLPSRRLMVRLRAPLEPAREYGVRVSGVVNVNGLGGGGGERSVRLEPASGLGGPTPANPGNGDS